MEFRRKLLLKTDIMHTASNCVCACTLNPLNRVLLQLLLFPEGLYLSQFDVSIRYGSSGSACLFQYWFLIIVCVTVSLSLSLSISLPLSLSFSLSFSRALSCVCLSLFIPCYSCVSQFCHSCSRSWSLHLFCSCCQHKWNSMGDLGTHCQRLGQFQEEECLPQGMLLQICHNTSLEGWLWWWLFPHMQEFQENFQQIISRLRFFFCKVEISSHMLIPLCRPGSAHSGSASWEDCDCMFPDELRVSSFPDRFPHYVWTVA